jgi:large subunit ribosomal protein L22
MKAHAQAKYIRQSPYKVRRVLDLVRGLPVEEARHVLDLTERRAADYVRKVLDSAVANAEHNLALDSEELFVVETFADEGPTLKRWRPRARGRATRINKRTSHITVVVSDGEEE